VAQILASIFILNPEQHPLLVLADPFLHLTILSSGFIIASGFIINSFYDLEKDTINNPGKVVFNRLITQQTCLNFYFLFNTIGMLLSFYVSKRVMLFNFLFSIALWFYSHKLKKKALLGNLSATVLSVLPFLVIVIYYKEINYAIFFYVAYIALIVLIRELLKDLISIKGDAVMGYQSAPVIYGVSETKKIMLGVMASTVLPPILLYFTYAVDLAIVYFSVGTIAVFISAIMLSRAENENDFERINTLYKGIILVGILSIMLV
jgi:4-hydroxybenzoate polyprenyltransferase